MTTDIKSLYDEYIVSLENHKTLDREWRKLYHQEFEDVDEDYVKPRQAGELNARYLELTGPTGLVMRASDNTRRLFTALIVEIETATGLTKKQLERLFK